MRFRSAFCASALSITSGGPLSSSHSSHRPRGAEVGALGCALTDSRLSPTRVARFEPPFADGRWATSSLLAVCSPLVVILIFYSRPGTATELDRQFLTSSSFTPPVRQYNSSKFRNNLALYLRLLRMDSLDRSSGPKKASTDWRDFKASCCSIHFRVVQKG
jgi:hypothetical protein